MVTQIHREKKSFPMVLQELQPSTIII